MRLPMQKYKAENLRLWSTFTAVNEALGKNILTATKFLPNRKLQHFLCLHAIHDSNDSMVSFNHELLTTVKMPDLGMHTA